MAVLVDNAGIARAKVVPADRLETLCGRGVGISHVLDVYTATDRVATTGKFITGPTGDLRLRADLNSLRLMSPAQTAWVAVDQYEQMGANFASCQRHALVRSVEAAARAGFRVEVGTEIEWTLFDSDTNTPAHEGPGYGASPAIAFLPYLESVFHALRDGGLSVEQLHCEYGRGQFEVSTGPYDPVTAADSSVFCREVIREVSRHHGYRASFSPVPSLGQVGNGAHVHLSLHQLENNLFNGPGAHGLYPLGSRFLAGIVDALPSLRLLGAPGPLTEYRLRPSNWAGAYACWGVENREAAVRLIQQGDGSNVEIKFGDSSMNPYLLLAGLIFTGLRGVRDRLQLEDPVQVDPATLDSEDAPKLLPAALNEAIAAFENDHRLRGDLGDDLVDAFLAVRRAELEDYGHLEARTVVDLLRWRY